MHLEIDSAQNLLRIDGQAAAGSHRWEAALLALLVQPDSTEARWLDAAGLDAALQAQGQRQPLNRKQVSRLFNSLEAMFLSASGGAHFSNRLRHAPRARTVGPWLWQRQADDQVLLHALPASALPTQVNGVLPQLAADGMLATSAALCRSVLRVQGMFHDGFLAGARDALDEAPAWAGASDELMAWHASRLAEALWKQRDFARAAEVIGLAERWVAQPGPAAMFLGDTVRLLRLRMQYVVDPMAAPTAVLAPLRPMLLHGKQVDRLAFGLGHNLAMLCHRRWLEDAGRDAIDADYQSHRAEALAHGFAALFCFATAELPAYAQSACVNLGYLLSRVAAQRTDATLEAALAWYALAQAWHNRFDLVDDTAWEYIFLGDLVLYRPHGLSAFKRFSQNIEWEGTRPDVIEFYDKALIRAREIGDPRQIAHTALNMMHFARAKNLHDAAAAAAAELAGVFGAHPDLRTLLNAEGYPLPRQTRSEASDRRTAP